MHILGKNVYGNKLKPLFQTKVQGQKNPSQLSIQK